MGVDYTAYAGFGLRLATENNYNEVCDMLEAASEDGDIYDIEFDDENIELIFDGMCGNYIYLLYKLSSEDAYAADATELSLNEFKATLEKVAPALSAAVRKLGIPNIEASDIKFISFVHAW